MNNIGGSLILLLVAIILLWLAVTDKLSRVLDAWDVIMGKSQDQTGLASNTASSTGPAGSVVLHLPSLPVLSQNAQVPAV